MKPFQRVDLIDAETLKGIKIVTTTSIGTLHGVDEDIMDTGSSTLALVMEFTDGTEQMVAINEEAVDELLRYICRVSTTTPDQAAKLYKGYLFLREALTQ